MLGQVDAAGPVAGERVVPVDPEQVAGVGGHAVDAGRARSTTSRPGSCDGSASWANVGSTDALLAEPLGRPGRSTALVDDVAGEAERGGEVVGHGRPSVDDVTASVCQHGQSA